MHAGGAERVASTLVNAWAARGDEVTLLITYSGRGECVYPLDERVRVVWLADHLARNHSILAPLSRFITLRRLSPCPLYTPPVAPTDFEWSGEPFGLRLASCQVRKIK